MSEQPNTPTPLPESERAASRAFEREAHHRAADELIEEAIDLLSFLELGAHLEDRAADEHFPLDATAVATTARVVVEKLRKAQSHHREVLP